MNKRPAGVAVLLTHNRKELLQKVQGLFSQTYPIEKIIIVDSVSTDGTYEMLQEKGIMAARNTIYTIEGK